MPPNGGLRIVRRTFISWALLASAGLLWGCAPQSPVPACNTAENCQQCVSIRDCGWCGAAQACVQGNSETPPATCAADWRWVPGTCPPPTTGAP
jgi:hypothetical protein